MHHVCACKYRSQQRLLDLLELVTEGWKLYVGTGKWIWVFWKCNRSSLTLSPLTISMFIIFKYGKWRDLYCILYGVIKLLPLRQCVLEATIEWEIEKIQPQNLNDRMQQGSFSWLRFRNIFLLYILFRKLKVFYYSQCFAER